jgi:hypothetical protein
MKAKDIFGFIFLLALFCVFFWFLDLRMARVFVAQYHSKAFSATNGEVMSAAVTQWTGSKGQIHYHPSITYRYQVDGKNYIGKRSRYDGHPSFYNEQQAQQIVDAHPKDSEIEVYYNPANPADSVLSRGLDTADFGIPLILGSLTFIFISLLANLARQIDWQGKGPPLAGGVKIIDDRLTIRVRLPRYQPAAMTSLIAFLLSMITGVIFQTASIDFPPFKAGLLTLAGIGLVSCAVYFYLRQKIESGSQDLIIDEGARTIDLPLTFKRREQVRLAFADIASVIVEKIRAGRSGYSYAVKLEVPNGLPQALTTLKRQDNAESFAVWLREKIGVKSEAKLN